MQIAYNGLGSFTFVVKPAQADVTFVTNPFSPFGDCKFPRSLGASLVVITHKGKDADNAEAIVPEHEDAKPPFVVTHAGEYEVQGVFVTGVDAPKKDGTPHTVYRFDVEGMHVGYLGAIDRALTEKEIEALGAVDVLILPVGGKDVLGASLASDLVAQIEPRLVIPSYVESGDGEYATVEAFVKDVGVPVECVTGKTKLARATLPEEDMKMLILAKG